MAAPPLYKGNEDSGNEIASDTVSKVLVEFSKNVFSPLVIGKRLCAASVWS